METNPQSRSADAGDDVRERTRARAGVFDLLRLGASLGADFLRGAQSDPARAGTRWATNVMRRDGAADVDIAVPGLPLELVGHLDHSKQVLSGKPGFDGYQAGKMKTSGMGFLAPGALTIANGETWARLRPYNEHVLSTGLPHPFAPTFLAHVREAFSAPVSDENDVRAAMGRAMVKIVLGNVSSVFDPAGDVTKLFGVVQSPVRRKLFGFLYRRRRERLYALLARKWERATEAGANEQTLLSLASHGAPGVDRKILLEQVPHWMFTFTGSGTDLLTRTLMLVTSRPEVHARVLEEIRAVGPADDAAGIGRLAYLEACVLETGRLFPPVTRTFHSKGPATGRAHEEIVHYFPLLQRDDRLGPTVHDFRPERWLAPTLDAAAVASNLFLRGPRACPGMDLILFVCKAAAARQLGDLGVAARQARLTRDPLPVSFPKPDARFTVSPRVS